jgi:MYXO-CTERM domain-containing protein
MSDPIPLISKSHALVLACAAAAALVGFGAPVNADTVTLTANDVAGQSSFGSGLHWSDGLAPHAGDDYVVSSSRLLRTPESTATLTFGGDSLTLETGGFLGWKGTANRTVTINNLTLDNGTFANSSNFTNLTATLAGNITLGAGGGNLQSFATGNNIVVSAPISGAGNLTILHTFTTASVALSGVNTYTGNTLLGDATVGNAALTLADDAGLKFVIGASGTNNMIVVGTAAGTKTLTLNGDFTFDLTSAGTTIGDTWQIVDNLNLTETYNSTFSVVGFTETANVWNKTVNDITYSFAESTGALSVTAVPEPASLGLALLGVGAAVLLRRRRLA